MTIATPKPKIINKEMTLTEISKLFSQNNLSKVAVFKDKRLIGTISRVDLMRALMKNVSVS
ncbi:CBS domain-containing protein [Lactococcus insecticola]|uniref:CBS domain-containing protein n=1 Tax=Pseudolactococcus insecticola TaxID=2709158 RepID=A0A6A0B4M8_9LACT|nr:CBS domain-containing protein [Lactococcus insecticola]GFH39653.1 hypothetical protein Hs20B_00510 [Lactococcus insecticola]